MKKIIRVIAFLLLCALIGAAFTACLDGPDDTPSDDPSSEQEDLKSEPSEPSKADPAEDQKDAPESKDDPEDKGDPVDPPLPTAVSVVFDSANGADSLTVTLTETEVLTEPEEPKKEGYTFLGWYLGDAEEPFVFSEEPIGKIDGFTLTAKWKQDDVPFRWRDLLPKNTETGITFSDFDFTLVKTENETESTLADVHFNDLASSYLIVDEEGRVKMAIDGKGNFQIMGESTDADLTAVMKDGKLYLLLTSDGREYTVNCDPYTFLDVAFVDITWNEILDGNEDAVTFVSKVLLPFILSGTDSGALDLSTLAKSADFLFTVTEDEGVTTYTLDFASLAELNDNLNQLSLKACMDLYFGKGTYSTVSALLERAVGLRVTEVVEYAELLNLDQDQIVEIVNALAKAAGREDFDLSVYLNDRKYRYTTVLSLILDDEDRTEYVEVLIDQIVSLGYTDSFYGILNSFFATEENPDVDLYQIFKSFLDRITDGFTYSFDLCGTELVSVRFLLPTASYAVTDEYEITLGMNVELFTHPEEKDYSDLISKVRANDLSDKNFAVVESTEEENLTTAKSFVYSATESSALYEESTSLSYREEIGILGECSCALFHGEKYFDCEEIYMTVTMQEDESDETVYVVSGVFTAELSDYVELTTGDLLTLYLPVSGEGEPSATRPEPITESGSAKTVTFVYDTVSGTATFPEEEKPE